MQRPLTRIVRNWFAWLMAVVLVGSLAIWFLTRPTLPGEVRIATAVPGGQYHEEGARIAEALRVRTNRKVQVLQTPGSEENATKLRAGEVDIAIVQAGSVSLEGLAVVTPLHRDVVHVIARKLSADNSAGGGAIRTISDLAGRNIIVGKNSSGMQHSAADVLDHYNLLNLVEQSSVHFTALMEDAGQGYAGAIVTTGIENEDLRRLLESGKFELIPLDAAALEKRHRHFEYYEIPSQLWPPVPDGPIPTVATSALVVVREDASSGLVKLLLDSIFEDGLPEYFSTLYTPQEARNIMPGRLHPMTRRYHDPFGRYGVLHTILEGLAAGKELLFALGAAVYLMWDRWRRIKERESQALIKEQKSRLDTYLEQTLEIERVQMDVFDPARLQQYLDEVTDIKLRALSRLTHEDLRGDRTFAIFLMQCANLISKIQLKIINCTK